MPNLLDGILADDAILAFADGDTFGESVTWTFSDLTTRVFSAQVNRQSPTPVGDTSDKFTSTKTIFVPRHATLGLTAVDKDKDTVLVPDVVGGTARKHRIVEIIHEDAGGWDLRLR